MKKRKAFVLVLLLMTVLSPVTFAMAGQVTEDTVMTTPEDHTLYAHWHPNTFYAEFVKNDDIGSTAANGTMSKEKFTYTVKQKLTKNLYTRTGYEHGGWTLNDVSYTDEQLVKDLTTEPDGTVTMQSVWIPNPFKVVYDYGSGNVEKTGKLPAGTPANPESVTYDVEFTVAYPKATVRGYEFKGWNIKNTKNYKHSVSRTRETTFNTTLVGTHAEINNNLTCEKNSTVTFEAIYGWANVLYRIDFHANPLTYQLDGAKDVKMDPDGTWNIKGKIPTPDPTLLSAYFAAKGGTTEGTFDGALITQDYGGIFPTASATGCTFIGWNTKPDGTGTYYTEAPAITGTGDVPPSPLDASDCHLDLYAIWQDDVTTTLFGSVIGKSGEYPVEWSNAENFIMFLRGKSDATGIYYMEMKVQDQTGAVVDTVRPYYPADDHPMNKYPKMSLENDDENNPLWIRFHRGDTPSGTGYGSSLIGNQPHHEAFNLQGHLRVTATVQSRSIKDTSYAAKAGTPQHVPTVWYLKMDDTKPSFTEVNIVQDTLANYASTHTLSDSGSGLPNLTTLFVFDVHDYGEDINGAISDKSDVSGIKKIWIVVSDKQDSSITETYYYDFSTNEKNGDWTFTGTVYTSEGNVLSNRCQFEHSFYQDPTFKDSLWLEYTIYAQDWAGNQTEETYELKDPEFYDVSPSDPNYDERWKNRNISFNDIPESERHKNMTGTFTNASIHAEVTNDDVRRHTGTPDNRFIPGEYGYVKVWTIGPVKNVLFDFDVLTDDNIADGIPSVGAEMRTEIAEGMELPRYSLDDYVISMPSTGYVGEMKADKFKDDGGTGFRVPTYFPLVVSATDADGHPTEYKVAPVRMYAYVAVNVSGTWTGIMRDEANYVLFLGDVDDDVLHRLWQLK